MEDQIVVVGIRMEPELLKALDEIVKAEDTDRSKYMRRLLRRDISERATKQEQTGKREKAAVR